MSVYNQEATTVDENLVIDMQHDFDPYELLLDTQRLVEDLADSHNNLVEDYVQTKQRLKSLEQQLIDIQIEMLKDDFE